MQTSCRWSCGMPKDPPPVADSFHPPISNDQVSNVKSVTSKSGRSEKPASKKDPSAPRKRSYDPDLFFKVNGKLYQRLGKIGSGGSSEVHKVISQDCTIYALKIIKLKGRDYATAYGFCQEIEYLNKLKGKDHIIQLIDYETPASGGSSHLSDQDPGVGGYRQTRRVGRVASSRRIRVGSWNIGTLTGKFFELVDALRRKKVDIACFQETKWKGSRTREGNQYKAALRVFDDPELIIENGHIGANADGFSSVHGGFGYGVRNDEGQTILEFAAAHDLVVVNSFFKKRDAHLITFHSGDHDTQIDYMLVRKGDLSRRPRSSERSVKPRILWKNLYGEAAEAFRARVIEGSVADAELMWNRLGKHDQRGGQGNPWSGCWDFENTYRPQGVMVD
ncbi:protein kinase, ATP binding site-containing protein [Tanacetum coccineum]